MVSESLTELQTMLLDLIRKEGVLTRREIAEAWHQDRLNPHDIAMLEDLVNRGLIKRISKLTGKVRTTYHYEIAD